MQIKQQQKSSQFGKDLQTALQSLPQNKTKIVQQALANQNDRQKLKTIKKTLQSSSESQLKSIFNQICSPIIVRQYIFGDLENKPTLLNIFKVLNVSVDVLINLMNELKQFQEVKMTVEVIQMLCISQKLTKQSKLILKNNGLIQKMYDICLCQLQNGANCISKNQFKTKWLQKFVQILRCINYIAKFIGEQRKNYVKKDQSAYKFAQICVQYCFLLNKQVITQLYILLVYLNKNLEYPSSYIKQIHYLHACTVVKGQITLKPLLRLANQIKDTELKAQLTPILLKSFQWFIQKQKKQKQSVKFDQQLTKNSFDFAISLFDVGRSIYSYLEQIIDIIITRGGNWSLQGNFTRKFFITKVALKHVPTKLIFQLWPNCLQDCFMQSGNMTMAYVADCAEVLLIKIYEQLNKDYNQWMKIWIQPYKNSLLSGNRSYIRGITQFINPILLKINSSNSLLLKQVMSMPQQNLNTQLGIISLIKCYKQVGKIQSVHNVHLQQQKRKKQQKSKKKGKNIKNQKEQQIAVQKKQQQLSQNKAIQKESNEQKKSQNSLKIVFIHLDDPSFQFGGEFLLDLLLSNEPMTCLQTLQFLITSKKPSYLIIPQQMRLIIEFYKNCLKTSMPQYRKSYLNLTRRMFERFRNNYQKQLSVNNQANNKQKKNQVLYFEDFVNFLNQLIQLCFLNIYPDSIFQLTNPALQILLLIVNIFGPKGYQIRKGTYIQPSNIISERTNFFNLYNFQSLVICLQSSYQSIRSIAYQIIKNYNKFDEQSIQGLRRLWDEAIQSTNKLSIKSYQFACRLVTYISSLNINGKYIIEKIHEKYSINRLNLANYLLQILKTRYEVFKVQFIQQNQIYYKNLIHGILTCYSYILDQISSVNSYSAQELEQIKSFLSDFFKQIIKILNFSVEICSANVSTVVLDTISNTSQTDKKMTVDCRGHFLPQKKQNGINVIGGYLDSTALISSMENQQQGIQNTLVVSFYLLTRQAGLVFQSIGGILGNSLLAKFVPKKELIQLVNTYFYALVNLKHMGSVDRISIGLSKMAKVIFDQQDKDLIKIPEQLLDKLLQLLNDGKFTNILRRSAGVPFAFTCLLKSQAIKRKLLIQKTIKSLLKLSQQSTETPIQLRIHGLNILKKLFQDSDLKHDLDVFVSLAFITSIKGFTSQQWGVRNSSLMLFSVLANRTVGIKPTYNLIQFFHKCPQLLQFISNQLQQKKAPTMYPPLYPIVLLLSRLLPFDLRQKARIVIKDSTTKQMRKQQLLTLLPLLRAAGDNHNYMGRVMTAKAILPFMHLSNITHYCLQLLQQYIQNRTTNKINNNAEHYRLTQCYQLLKSYQQIKSNTNSDNPNSIIQIPKQTKSAIYKILISNTEVLQWSQSYWISPTVHEIVVRIYGYFLENYFNLVLVGNIDVSKEESYQGVGELNDKVCNKVQGLFEIFIKQDKYGDLGHSLMIKSCIKLLSVCYKNQIILSKNQKYPHYYQTIGRIYIQYLNSPKLTNLQNQSSVDYQILCEVLQKIDQLIVLIKKFKVNQQKFLLYAKLNKWLQRIDLNKVQNDNTFIKILSIFQTNPWRYQKQNHQLFINNLQKIESQTQNKHMKVAIFSYLLQISFNQTQTSTQMHIQQHENQSPKNIQNCLSFLQSLLQSYSNPDQLEDLRECCILYLEKAQKLKSSLLIVYIRLLQDQQYEIRKRAAYHISRMLHIKPCNQLVVLRQLLSRFLTGRSFVLSLKNFTKQQNIKQQKICHKMDENQQAKFIVQLLDKNSDYNIRTKNHIQQRIFSYDKPNKYRTDINTLFQILTLASKTTIKQSAKLYMSNTKNMNDLSRIENIIENYMEKIMQRDQYQFESIVRAIFVGQVIGGGRIGEVGKIHPIFWGLYRKIYQ